jgi:hypothetical protein
MEVPNAYNITTIVAILRQEQTKYTTGLFGS